MQLSLWMTSADPYYSADRQSQGRDEGVCHHGPGGQGGGGALACEFFPVGNPLKGAGTDLTKAYCLQLGRRDVRLFEASVGTEKGLELGQALTSSSQLSIALACQLAR